MKIEFTNRFGKIFYLHDSLPLQKAVNKYLRHLGKESFFDLY